MESQRFALNDIVTCHADCLTDPVRHNHWTGRLVERATRNEDGWWYMEGRHGNGKILVHEQELAKHKGCRRL